MTIITIDASDYVRNNSLFLLHFFAVGLDLRAILESQVLNKGMLKKSSPFQLMNKPVLRQFNNWV